MYNGNILRDAIISGANNITNNKQSVDELNVFPVPDGDTGTNMSLSIGSAASELAYLNDETAGRVAEVTASALLRGARGNSGVITSLLFRGFAKALKGKETIDAQGFCDAMSLGVEAAYKAVMKPTEGTMLTVARLAAESAKTAVAEGRDALAVFEEIVRAADEALQQTPEMLPVLKKAGVVDAGGQGYLLILQGMLSVFKNGEIIASNNAETAAAVPKNAAGQLESDITFTYCTEFIVNKDDGENDSKKLRAYLETIGDCVVVVDDESIIKVHVHTNHPGKAIEKALTWGPLVNLKIENMRDQHERAKHDAKGEAPKKEKINQSETEEYTSVDIEKPYGFVAVSVGDGLKELFSDLGADMIVSGGQTMNPSTQDILRAVELTPAETVFVLPNNKNIIMAAEQAVPLSSRNIIVLPTRTIPQGISAMLSFDPDASADENAIAMQKGYENVSTGQITFAARDSSYNGKKILKGELLALANGKISFGETDMVKSVCKLTKALASKSTSFVTLIYGEEITEEQAQEAADALKEKMPEDVEITVVNGGQPVYYYIISVE